MPDLPGWCERMKNNEHSFDKIENLSSGDKARETLVMWLRMTEGVDTDDFWNVTGQSIDELCGDAVRAMVEEGLLIRTGSRLALSRDALFICNSVFSELV